MHVCYTYVCFLSLLDLGQMFVLVYYAPNPTIFFSFQKIIYSSGKIKK